MGICTSCQTNLTDKQMDKTIGKCEITQSDEFHKYKVYIPPITSGKVIKVYDGDTITIIQSIPGSDDSEMYKFSIRLNGIDTPEIKTKNQEEKQIAKIAQQTLYDKIFNKNVILKNVKLEKYGRLLFDVYYDNQHLNKWLLDLNLAVPYDGGTKNIPESWIDYYNNKHENITQKG